MNNLLSTILLLFLPVFGCGLLVFRVVIKEHQLKLILAFSAAYLLALTFLHLMPEVFEQGSHDAGMFILIGFFIQLFIDYFSTGIEHGHIHIHKEDKNKIPLTIIFGLYVHSFLEGLPIAELMNQGSITDSLLNFKNSMILGLTLHNIPIAIAFVTLLKQLEIKKNQSVLFLLLFSLMAPLGVIANELMQYAGVSNINYIIHISLGIVIGIFLHISTTIMFESSSNHKYNFAKMSSILLGAALAYLIS
jgi:zinc and cadmium transporter